MFFSKIFWYSFILSLFELFGILRGLPQTNAHLEKGKVIRNLSHEWSFLNFVDAKPTGIIGIFADLAILIMPSDTFWLGPLGPSGVIPI